jgi:hypothetical protein
MQKLREIHKRIVVSIPARFSILIPENTFSPVELDCEVLDMSERGAMINVCLSSETYSMMLGKTRFCRLRFSEKDHLPKKVGGRAVWLQPQGNDSRRSYRIGLFFEHCPAETVSLLTAYVNRLS